MKEAKLIKVLSFAKLQALLLALVGVLTGTLYSCGGVVYDLATTGGVNGGTALAFLALFGMPLIFAAGGFALGLIEAVLFNLLAKRMTIVNLDITH